MSNTGTQKKPCIFELSSFQRRLRHLRSIAVRNLACSKISGKDISRLQSYFSLHKDEKSKAFYTSEKIMGSLNPTWQSFDISRYEAEINLTAQFVIVRVWITLDHETKLLLDWHVHLTGLTFCADKLQQDTMKYAKNTVVFGMFDQFFVAPTKPCTENKEEIVRDFPLEGNTAKVSYTASSLHRIHYVLRAVKQTQVSVSKVHRSIEDKLLSSQEKSKKLSEREELLLSIKQLRSEMTWKMSHLQTQREELEKLEQKRDRTRKLMNDRIDLLEKERNHLAERKRTHNNTRENLKKENAQLWIRRKQLIGELACSIYPITEKKKDEWYICGVKLPNSEEFQGHDDSMLAVALSYTTHMLSMMSDILDIPLRYPMNHYGSRSTIYDHIHTKLTEKDREFPLYSKGKEKFQFNYGVFLLNKNISQMRFFCGLGTTDLRTTLLNIKSLLELRLGVRYDNSGLHTIYVGSDGKEKNLLDFDRADTHSSLASGGRLSIPDSADVIGYENALKEAKLNFPSRNPQNIDELDMSRNSSVQINGESENDAEEMFRPSPDDGFFRVSNPVSEQLGMFNDINSVAEGGGTYDMMDENSIIHLEKLTMDTKDRRNMSDVSIKGAAASVCSVQKNEIPTDSQHGAEDSALIVSRDRDGIETREHSSSDLHSHIHVDDINVITDDKISVGEQCQESDQQTDICKGDHSSDFSDVEKVQEKFSAIVDSSSTKTENSHDGEIESLVSNAVDHLNIPDSSGNQSAVNSRESSVDSDSSINYKSFKTTAFKQSCDSACVESDTKSYDSVGSSPKDMIDESKYTIS